MSEKIVQLNEEIIKGQIRELVRSSVEETLNELLEKEAESLTQTPVRGGELVLLGIFDPADGSNVPHRTPQLRSRIETNITVRGLLFQAFQARLSHPFPCAP